MSGEPRHRVLHLTKGINAGGTETLLVLAARHRDRNRFKFEVAHLLPDDVALRAAVRAEDADVTCIGGRPWWDPRWLVRLRRLLIGRRIDLVHVHAPLVAAGARLVVRTIPSSRRPKIVVTLHNMWESHHPLVRLLDRATYRLDDLRLTVSDAVRRSLPTSASHRAITQIHGIDVDDLRRADRAVARELLGVDPGDLVVGTVANLRSTKGYPDLIEAARSVTESEPRARFVSIGQGPQRDELEALRDAAGLGDRFRFLGFRPDASRLMAGFDVFCLASHHEGLPLALMEALVLGVPVVVTDVGGVGELVTDRQEGSLVPAGRPDLLAAALSDLLADEDRRTTSAKAARAKGDHLDAEAAEVAIEQQYLSLLGSADG